MRGSSLVTGMVLLCLLIQSACSSVSSVKRLDDELDSEGIYLCSECRNLAFTCDIGTCTKCGGPTTSGAFRYCSECARKLDRCQACGTDLWRP